MNDATGGDNPSVVAYPAIGHQDDLNHLIRLAQWNLAPWVAATGGHIVLPVLPALSQTSCDVAGVVITTEKADRYFETSEAILSWSQPGLIGAPRHLHKTALPIDPYFDVSSSDTLNQFVASQLQDPQSISDRWEQSVQTLNAFRSERSIMIIGSGPHRAEDRALASETAPFPIILGTALMDDRLLQALPPGLILLADGVGQFGAATAPFVLRRVTQQLERGAHLVIPEELGPLVRRNLNEKHGDKLHLMPMGGAKDDLWSTGRARPLANVLTTMGLPMAATLATQGETIKSLGVSFQPADIESPASRHWDRHTTLIEPKRNGMAVLAFEPGSVLPDPTYMTAHYGRLKELTDRLLKIGIYVEGRDTGSRLPKPTKTLRRGIVSRIFAGVDHVEQWRHAYAMLALIGFTVSLFAFVSTLGVGTAALLLTLALAALFVSLATFVLLRLRMRRWMAEFERRRRQVEARELEFTHARLNAIEKKLGLSHPDS